MMCCGRTSKIIGLVLEVSGGQNDCYKQAAFRLNLEITETALASSRVGQIKATRQIVVESMPLPLPLSERVRVRLVDRQERLHVANMTGERT